MYFTFLETRCICSWQVVVSTNAINRICTGKELAFLS